VIVVPLTVVVSWDLQRKGREVLRREREERRQGQAHLVDE
jgi:hypothetical protein